ncbi:MAG: DNA polymerase III subunit chi [Proteobacteria bacterium]|nr:DNA polymerase III subunit chi [Pseudomonadota bacterium]
MTRVDFYVMDNPNLRQHEQLVCRLAEKAWGEGHAVHIRCPSSEAACSVDSLLWTYKDTSFLPHAMFDSPDAATTKITIGFGTTIPVINGILINLGPDVPDYFSRFERVMETTGGDSLEVTAARARYRFYQERGYTLNTHKLEAPRG